MKRTILIAAILLASSKAFSQTGGLVTEERSSNWVVITAQKPAVAAKTTRKAPVKRTTVKKKQAPVQPEEVQPQATDAFQKTNSQIKRFKKG
jgi:hypothetical protein